MKYLILAIFLLQFSSKAYTQTAYHAFDSLSVVSLEHTGNSFPFGGSYYNVWTQNLNRDTIINNQQYRFLDYQYNWYDSANSLSGQVTRTPGLIREDSSGKLYFRSFGDLNNSLEGIYRSVSLNYLLYLDSVFAYQDEILLFDAGMSIGDSILHYTPAFPNASMPYDSLMMHVYHIDSIQLKDNSLRKRFHLKGSYHSFLTTPDSVYYTWVEGLGIFAEDPFAVQSSWIYHQGILGSFHLFYITNVSGLHEYTKVRCFSEKEVFLLGDSTFCDSIPPVMLHQKLVKEPRLQVQIAPNPFQNQTKITVTGTTFKTLRFQLFDLTGQAVSPIQTSDVAEFIIHRNQLKQGLYFYKLWGGDAHIIDTGKLIVH